jgi:putative tryptophan/tyrosine transport system substrate-binding protein
VIRRREFITLLGGAAVAWPLSARAQPSGKTYRIGFLGPTSYAERKRDVDALRTGLRQLGYEEGRNIVIHYRWAEGRYDRLAEFAAELVKLNMDVIVTVSTPGALAAKQATSTIPIVMAAVGDPVAAGIVASLARPSGNLTGLIFFFAEICAKRVELIKEAMLEYGVDLADLYSRSAAFVDKILKGTPPADLPIERAVKFELIVNLKTAKALGIELPTSILLRANEVLE